MTPHVSPDTSPHARRRDPRMDRELQLDGLRPAAARRAFSDLTAYLNAPLDAIAGEYWRHRDHDDVAAQQHVARAADESVVHEYYAATPNYLYELSYWEASADKQAWSDVILKACRARRLTRVLDFGGGVGSLTLHLRRHGLQCDHLDVPGRTRDYAAWRFQRHGVAARVLDATDSAVWPWGEYDAVVAWDVLEHLFDLEGAIANIHRLLRPGGWFIEKSTFAEAGHADGAGSAHIHLAQHACYHDLTRFDQLLAGHGLRFVGQLKPDRLSRLLRGLGLRHAVAGVRIAPRLKHGGNFLVHQKA